MNEGDCESDKKVKENNKGTRGGRLHARAIAKNGL